MRNSLNRSLPIFIVAVFCLQIVPAEVDPLASPTLQAGNQIAALGANGFNPRVPMSEGTQGDIHPSDINASKVNKLKRKCLYCYLPVWGVLFTSCVMEKILFWIKGVWFRSSTWKQDRKKGTSQQVQIPVYQTCRYPVGFWGIKKKVPQYDQEGKLVGYRTIRSTKPIFVEKQIPVGSKTIISPDSD